MKKAFMLHLSLAVLILIFIAINSGNASDHISGKITPYPGGNLDSLKNRVDDIIECPPPDTPCHHDIAGGDTVALDNLISSADKVMDDLVEEKESSINSLDSIDSQLIFSKRQVDSATSFGFAVSPSAFTTYQNFKIGKKNAMNRLREIDLLMVKLDYYIDKLTLYFIFR